MLSNQLDSSIQIQRSNYSRRSKCSLREKPILQCFHLLLMLIIFFNGHTSVTSFTSDLFYLNLLRKSNMCSSPLPPRSPRHLVKETQQQQKRMKIDDDDDTDDDDDDEPPSVDTSKFVPPTLSFGLNKGRSSPSQRKAMGTSGSGTTKVHVCTKCGSEFVKWMGRCPTCREWNTLQEVSVKRDQRGSSRSTDINPYKPSSRHSSWLDFDGTAQTSGVNSMNKPIRLTDVYPKISSKDKSHSDERICIPQDQEMNNVLGGGIMMGSLTLLGGDPGVGKSTLLLQIAAYVASLATPTPKIGMGLGDITKNKSQGGLGPVWYISGEETAEQIASRAMRLGIEQSELWLLSETHVDVLVEQAISAVEIAQAQARDQTSNDSDNIANQDHTASALTPRPPSLLVIDSIQTMICDAGGSAAAGGVTQMRECVSQFLRLAKTTRIPIILVGHVTKSGGVAGPRTIEHMVDSVLYLEGSNDNGGGTLNLRMLRASKNRFGPNDEVGMYDMTDGQLVPVSDPSSLLMAQRFMINDDNEGCSVTLSLEGIRVLTVEVQALVTDSNPPSARTTGGGGGGGGSGGRRVVSGIAYSRLILLLAVLQKRCGMSFFKHDVFVNVVGQIRLDRVKGGGSAFASDLAIAVAIVSSLTSIKVRTDTAFVGEVGLLGELRPVSALPKRIQEAQRMGFLRVITPRSNYNKRGPSSYREYGIEWIQCNTLLEAIKAALVSPLPRKRKSRTPSINQVSRGNSQGKGIEIIDDGDEDEDVFL